MITWKCYINFIKQYKCTSSDNELSRIQLNKNQGESDFFLSEHLRMEQLEQSAMNWVYTLVNRDTGVLL